jgi:hypothetical protein
VDQRAASTIHRSADIEVPPKVLYRKRISTEKHFANTLPHGMRSRALDAGTGNPGIHIGFADALDPLVGPDYDDEAVLSGRRVSGIHFRSEQNVARDIGDLHGTPSADPTPA